MSSWGVAALVNGGRLSCQDCTDCHDLSPSPRENPVPRGPEGLRAFPARVLLRRARVFAASGNPRYLLAATDRKAGSVGSCGVAMAAGRPRRADGSGTSLNRCRPDRGNYFFFPFLLFLPCAPFLLFLATCLTSPPDLARQRNVDHHVNVSLTGASCRIPCGGGRQEHCQTDRRCPGRFRRRRRADQPTRGRPSPTGSGRGTGGRPS